MTTEQKDIIKNSWQKISTLDDTAVGSLFYNKLFELAPQVRGMFTRSVPEQSKKLMAMLHYMVRNIDKPGELSETISALAQQHVKYKVEAYHYAVVGSALLWTLSQGLGADWNNDAEEAWVAFYSIASQAMIQVHETVMAA